MAHPHVFAEANLEVALDDGGMVVALRHVWRFDDLFSSTVLLEFDKNADLVLDNAELEEVGAVIHESLAEFDYFQFVTAKGRDVKMQAPERIMANFEDNQLIILFESRPVDPLKLDGTVDFGVTGEDLVREGMADVDTKVEFCTRLGFGQADVVVAVPEIWLDVETMEDLGDVAADFRTRHGRRLAIATKYWRLTQQFFSRQHGIQLYRIVESLGATEGAPAAGQADIIVDITSTGSTLRANHLKVLGDGVILKSEACLVRARKADHEHDPRIARIMQAIRGEGA